MFDVIGVRSVMMVEGWLTLCEVVGFGFYVCVFVWFVELFLLVIYDVSDDGLRSELASFLRSQGLRRVQRSAFLGPATMSSFICWPRFRSRVVITDVKYEELLDESGLIT